MEFFKSIFLLTTLSSLLSSFSIQAHNVAPSSAPTTSPNTQISFTATTPLLRPKPIATELIPSLPNLPQVATMLSLNIPTLDLSIIDNNIETICSGTDYFTECLLGIIPHFNDFAKEGINPSSVLKMEMATLCDKATETVKEVTTMREHSSTSLVVSGILDTCVENYESLLEDLKDAVRALEIHDLGRLESLVSATLQDIVTCSDSFHERPGVRSPLADGDDLLKKMCSNILAISSSIKFY
ncbi:uncharacterized protein LOC110819585 [Carica papaya]|uniref:uncharacterized protein LOC110819585 n=1 Tax=Carica papaya TaxID=3649 RepID=UPI000B8C9566|nr:uncharacterized protein LOC110819585 [Carica papaya]